MSFLLMVSVIVVAVWTIKRNKKQKRKAFIEKIEIPNNIGYRKEIPLRHKVKDLDIALDNHFQERIKNRYMDEHANKLVVEHEYDLLFLELKRFFVMCSLLRYVPMFSEKVDDIWHEMLMFTKEYDQFSKKFYGQFLHHEPVEKKTPQPDSRAFFDLVYTQLFEFTAYTTHAWGGFYQNPLNRNQIEEFLYKPVTELKQEYFRQDADNELVTSLILELKDTIQLALREKNVKIQPNHYKRIQEYSPLLATGMIYYSVNNPELYAKHMIPAHSTSSSNCSSGCGTGGDGDSGSGSSCGSSCGGGCGGGCGGS
jgi:uncharacterized membrane protein YgcG